MLFNRWLLRAVKKRLGPMVFTLVASPYLLRINVVDVASVKSKINRFPGLNVRGTVITGVVEEVFQPRRRISAGDTVKFYYTDFWRPSWLNFKPGLSYFAPLTSFRDSKLAPFTLMFLDGRASYGRYPIVNGTMTDRGDFFGYGASVSWKAFRKILLEHIAKIRSW